jgi:O-antigen ligase
MKENKKISFDIWGILLVVGVISAPMTTFRIWKLGIAEVSILLWSIKILLDNKLKFKFDYFILLTLLLNACLFMGFSYRIFFNINTGDYLEESITYMFFNFFIIVLSQYLQMTNIKEILFILKRIFWSGFFVYFCLYLYSIFISHTIFGRNLWYGDGERLSILADNPHQFVFFIGPVSIIGLFLIKINFINTRYEKNFTYIAILGYIIMGIETKSSTLLATYVSIILIIFLFNASAMKSSKKKSLLIGMKLVFLIILFMIFLFPIRDIINTFIESDPNGLGRFTLWESGIKIAMQNPLFGLGPGAHIFNPYMMSFEEAHNTYVDIALRGGIFALIIYLTILFKSLIITKHNVYATSIILFFCLYGMAGFSYRRITLWFFIMTIVYIFKKSIKNSNELNYL